MRRHLAIGGLVAVVLSAQPLSASDFPQMRIRRQKIEVRRNQALVCLEQARRMLLEEIPARAKKENVPPKWLL